MRFRQIAGQIGAMLVARNNQRWLGYEGDLVELILQNGAADWSQKKLEQKAYQRGICSFGYQSDARTVDPQPVDVRKGNDDQPCSGYLRTEAVHFIFGLHEPDNAVDTEGEERQKKYSKRISSFHFRSFEMRVSGVASAYYRKEERAIQNIGR
jgi:hypothetical protein